MTETHKTPAPPTTTKTRAEAVRAEVVLVKDLCFTYPTGTASVLKEVSFSIYEGSILSILGPNGAGKSTLLDCLAGLQTPDSGAIYLSGRLQRDIPLAQYAALVGYVPQQHIPAFSYTLLDFVVLGRAPHIAVFSRPKAKDFEKARRALKRVGLEQLADKPYTQMSGGERQQATIARVLCQEPKIILFDEPTSHLDYGNQYQALSLIQELASDGYAVVITTHNPDHALLLGGDVALLNKSGTLTNGQVNEILTEERLRALYGVELSVAYRKEAKRTACILPSL